MENDSQEEVEVETVDTQITIRSPIDRIEKKIAEGMIEGISHDRPDLAMTLTTLFSRLEEKQKMYECISSTCVTTMDKRPLPISMTLSELRAVLRITNMAGQTSEALVSQESEMDTSSICQEQNCLINGIGIPTKILLGVDLSSKPDVCVINGKEKK